MDSCSLVYDELCDIRDTVCAQGRLEFDSQSLFVDHLGHLVTWSRPRFHIAPTNVAILDHSHKPLFPAL